MNKISQLLSDALLVRSIDFVCYTFVNYLMGTGSVFLADHHKDELKSFVDALISAVDEGTEFSTFVLKIIEENIQGLNKKDFPLSQNTLRTRFYDLADDQSKTTENTWKRIELIIIENLISKFHANSTC